MTDAPRQQTTEVPGGMPEAGSSRIARPASEMARERASVAGFTATIAGVFAVVIAGLLVWNAYRLQEVDPLLSEHVKRLDALTAQHREDPDHAGIRNSILLLDQRLRQDYFQHLRFATVGGYLLLATVIVFLVAYWIHGARTAPSGAASASPGPGASEARAAGARLGGVILVLAFFVLGLFAAAQAPTHLPDRFADVSTPSDDPGDGAQASSARAGTDGAGAEPSLPPRKTPDLATRRANFGSFRGADGSGWVQREGVPVSWNEAKGEGIAWKSPIPLDGFGSPILWGDRVYVAGATREKRALFCYDRADGTLLWTGTYKSDPKAVSDYPVWEDLKHGMHAAATPATDGWAVYALFANGEVVAFDTATGAPIWSRLLGSSKGNMYGMSGSLLVGEHLYVQWDSDTYRMLALDPTTGKEVWQSERESYTWASPILIHPPDSPPLIVSSANPNLSAWNAETGARLWAAEILYGDVAPSPIYAGGRIITAFENCGIFAYDPAGKALWSVEEMSMEFFSNSTSPVATNRYVYHAFEDAVTCLNAETGEEIFGEIIEEKVSYASPLIVNDRLYVFCGKTTYVAPVGPTWKILHANTLAERTDCAPAVGDGQLFIRTGKSLYCIGRKP